MFAGFTFIAGLLPLVGKPVLDSGYFCGLLLMLDVTCCYDGWGLLIGLFLRCFAIGDYSSSYFALFWEACSLLRALFGSVAVDAGLWEHVPLGLTILPAWGLSMLMYMGSYPLFSD
ncbi:hypothetical protein NC652_022228 [Populus alba x Populus x berolinensis]|nr:hypothetical protein NC652_022228 [Populus alba x Populus x berolinensis]